MDTLRDILELLYSAYERFSTIQATSRTWYDVVRVREGWERWAAQQPPGSVAVLEPLEADAAAAARPAPAISEWVERLWLHKPARCRYESGLAGERPDAIIRGDCVHQVSSPPESPGMWFGEMLDPAPLIPYLWLQPLGRAVYAGREAIRVRGVPRRKLAEGISPALLWLSADEYDLLVDAERGVLLRITASMDGAAFAGTELVRVVFDEAIPDSVLTSSGPGE